MSKTQIARRIDASDKVKKFKKLLEAQSSNLNSLLEELKQDINPKIKVRFDELVKIAKDKVSKKHIPDKTKKQFNVIIDFINKQVKNWSELSVEDKDSVLTNLAGLERQRAEVGELETLHELVRLWIEIYIDFDYLNARIVSLSDKSLWKKLTVYVHTYEAQLMGTADDSSKSQIIKFGNILILRIKTILLEISELLKSLSYSLSLLRGSLSNSLLLDMVSAPKRRKGDISLIDQRLYAFFEDLSNDIKQLPLLG